MSIRNVWNNLLASTKNNMLPLKKIAFEIEPFLGIGPIRLGMDRNEVRKQFNRKNSSYRKGIDADHETDTFFENSFQVFYDKNDKVVFIELSGYKSKYFDVFYKGINLFATKVEKIIESIGTKIIFDEKDFKDSYEMTLPEFGIAFWRPVTPDEEDYKIEEDEYDEYGNGFYWQTVACSTMEYLNRRTET